MKKGRIFLICIALVMLGVVYKAFSAPPNDDLTRPMLKEGQLFSVKLTPRGKKLEVAVSGRDVARLEQTQFGLIAMFRVGNRTLKVEPERKGGVYWIDRPMEEAASNLNLEIRSGSEKENFSFELKKVRP